MSQAKLQITWRAVSYPAQRLHMAHARPVQEKHSNNVSETIDYLQEHVPWSGTTVLSAPFGGWPPVLSQRIDFLSLWLSLRLGLVASLLTSAASSASLTSGRSMSKVLTSS